VSGVLILQPWEAYKPDTSIDLTRHHEPKVLLDKIAYWTVKLLRVPTDIFFQVSLPCSPLPFPWNIHVSLQQNGAEFFQKQNGSKSP
jgi:hypothetical protein